MLFSFVPASHCSTITSQLAQHLSFLTHGMSLPNRSRSGSVALRAGSVGPEPEQQSKHERDVEANDLLQGTPYSQDSARYFEPYQRPKLMKNSHRSKVIEYLSKKGYTKTEAMLRAESATHDIEGRPLVPRAEDAGGQKYGKAWGMITCLAYDITY